MRIIRFVGWVLRSFWPLPISPKTNWTWADCYRHAKNKKPKMKLQSGPVHNTTRYSQAQVAQLSDWKSNRMIRTYFPSTEKESIALQTYLFENGWISTAIAFAKGELHGDGQTPIIGMGDRNDRYLEFDLDAHTFTWDNWQQENCVQTTAELIKELPILVVEYNVE